MAGALVGYRLSLLFTISEAYTAVARVAGALVGYRLSLLFTISEAYTGVAPRPGSVERLRIMQSDTG